MRHRFSSSLSRVGAIGLTLAAAIVLAACSKQSPVEEPVRAVKVLTVGASPLQSTREFAGEVRARTESRLGFRVAGKIVQRQVDLGQHVNVGDVLAQLDAQDYQLTADAARAQAAAARTNRDLAAADLQRYRELRAQNFISDAELDRREAQLKAAQAQLDQAEAQLTTQGNQARYAKLVADAAGVVTAIEAEPGQVVAAGAPVLRIAQDGPRDVVFSVPEGQVALMINGMPVQLRIWATGEMLPGRVREVAASADPVTRTFLVKASIEASDSARKLPPLGATVAVLPSTPVQAKNANTNATTMQAIKLPSSALRQDGQVTAVWVLDTATMTVRSQPVQVSTADGNEAVIASGLQPGQLVVATGVHVLSPGQKVTIYQPKSAQAAE
ncbi:efflux RND transporter periplasmic adaptor subunit [Hylemonella gracilis]|uniref:RND family efflux transporter MFP subunit n=1 Tax=Hylemonella gracilis ATCC 19624 TaxID=887062 RepID=F3KRH9_9BURK|nr:efflux RND transporter periplasmic adaptor subunit [Hylemonella gracilis]EGI77578.1 RND family efflux transporter MFP subunit [Hylemonella gracilis ATCC 19624]